MDSVAVVLSRCWNHPVIHSTVASQSWCDYYSETESLVGCKLQQWAIFVDEQPEQRHLIEVDALLAHTTKWQTFSSQFQRIYTSASWWRLHCQLHSRCKRYSLLLQRHQTNGWIDDGSNNIGMLSYIHRTISRDSEASGRGDLLSLISLSKLTFHFSFSWGFVAWLTWLLVATTTFGIGSTKNRLRSHRHTIASSSK